MLGSGLHGGRGVLRACSCCKRKSKIIWQKFLGKPGMSARMQAFLASQHIEAHQIVLAAQVQRERGRRGGTR